MNPWELEESNERYIKNQLKEEDISFEKWPEKR
jgi:hypothetical protein